MTEVPIGGVRLRRLQAHRDRRGSFTEIFRAAELQGSDFVQANHSRSRQGVLRGLHFHTQQADLWYVSSGRIQVALADLRRRMPAPKTTTFVLAADEPAALYIPPGVAHGYLALNDADLIYWVTHEYDGSDEHGIAWDDPTLGIPWQIRAPVLSERDAANPGLRWDEIPSF